jgi:phosphopentomutase
VNLGTRKSFADLGQSIAEALGIKRLAWGESFMHVVTQG